MTREHEGEHAARLEACRRLRTRVDNAKICSAACVLDAVAVLQRLRRASAARRGEPYEPDDLTELVAEARQAFAGDLPERGFNPDDLKRLLDRIRAHDAAVDALSAKIPGAIRK